MFRLPGLAVLAESTEELVQELDAVWWELGVHEGGEEEETLSGGEEEEWSRDGTLDVEKETHELWRDIEECIRARMRMHSALLQEMRLESLAVERACRELASQLGYGEERCDRALASVSDASTVRRIQFLRGLEATLAVEMEERRTALALLKEKLQERANELGMTMEDLLFSFGIDSADLNGTSLDLVTALEEAIARADAALDQARNEIEELKSSIVALWDALGMTEEDRQCRAIDRFVSSPVHCFFDAETDVTFTLDETKKSLLERREELEALYERMYTTVPELMPKILRLWHELEVEESDKGYCTFWEVVLGAPLALAHDAQRDFIDGLEETTAYPAHVITAVEEELQRLEGMRNDRYRHLVMKERDALAEWWDKLHMGEEERLAFEPGHCEECSLEVLQACRQEIRRLRKLFSVLEPLLRRIERREWIKEQMRVFEQGASDPNRFRGNSSRLLQEEKFRKIVSKEFPRLTEELRETLEAWYEEHGGEAFYYDGESYLDTMDMEDEDPSFHLLHLRLLSNKTARKKSGALNLTPRIGDVGSHGRRRPGAGAGGWARSAQR